MVKMRKKFLFRFFINYFLKRVDYKGSVVVCTNFHDFIEINTIAKKSDLNFVN
jgi:hypothetical protein